MSEADLDRIKRDLGLRLPATYRGQLSPFPVPHETGNSTTQVWDDADRLIDLNRRLRAEGTQWPDWLLVIGQALGDPSGYAIDTRTPDAPVWWLERMRLGPNSGPCEGSFSDWFARWVHDASETPGSGGGLSWWLAAWVALSVAGIAAVWLWVACS